MALRSGGSVRAPTATAVFSKSNPTRSRCVRGKTLRARVIPSKRLFRAVLAAVALALSAGGGVPRPSLHLEEPFGISKIGGFLRRPFCTGHWPSVRFADAENALSFGKTVLRKEYPSEHVARRVQTRVWQSDRGNHPVASSFGRPQRNEQNLILARVNCFQQFPFQRDLLASIQVALENRVLQVASVVAANLEHPAQPFVIGHIIADQKGSSHWEARCGKRLEIIGRNSMGERYRVTNGTYCGISPVRNRARRRN